jgi:hypothetical protein
MGVGGEEEEANDRAPAARRRGSFLSFCHMRSRPTPMRRSMRAPVPRSAPHTKDMLSALRLAGGELPSTDGLRVDAKQRRIADELAARGICLHEGALPCQRRDSASASKDPSLQERHPESFKCSPAPHAATASSSQAAQAAQNGRIEPPRPPLSGPEIRAIRKREKKKPECDHPTPRSSFEYRPTTPPTAIFFRVKPRESDAIKASRRGWLKADFINGSRRARAPAQPLEART